MEAVRVKVVWTTKEEGGRSSLPTSLEYSTIAKFENFDEEWQHAAWSVVLNFNQSPFIEGRVSFAIARFLSEAAPTERLQSKNQFDLYEGFKKVAHVEVI